MKKYFQRTNLLLIILLSTSYSELFSQIPSTELSSWEGGLSYNANGFLGSIGKLSDCPTCLPRSFSEGDAGEVKFNSAYFARISESFYWGVGLSSSLDFWYFTQTESRETLDTLTKKYKKREIIYETNPFVWDFSLSGKIRYSVGKFKITSSLELVIPVIKNYDQNEKLANAGGDSFSNNSDQRNTFDAKNMTYFSSAYLSTDMKLSYDIKSKDRDQSVISPYLLFSYSLTSLHKDEDWKYYSFGFGVDLRLPTYSAGNNPVEPSK